MKKKGVLMILLVWLVLGLAASGLTQQKPPAQTPKPVDLKFATFSQGSAWYFYAAGMSEILKKNLPSGSRIDVLPYAGGVGNAKVIGGGEAQIGFLHSIGAKWAYEGIVAFDRKYDNLRALVGGLDRYYAIAMIRADLKINSLKEIKERKVPVKLAAVQLGGMGEFAGRLLLESYGFGYEDIKKWGGSVNPTSYDVTIDNFKDGRANLHLNIVPARHPTITDISLSTNVKFLPLDPEQIKYLNQKYGMTPVTMPAGMFKGQDKDLPLVATFTVLLATKDLPENLAYLITKAIIENVDAVKSSHKGLSDFDPKTAWRPEKAIIPLHPGAEKYYRNAGLMK
jgi:TRAP transporter TAXI family solute receptor